MFRPVCCTRSGPVPYAGTSRIRFYGFAKRVSTERYPDNLKYTVCGFSSSPPQSHTPNLCWNDGMSPSSWANGTEPSKLSSRWLCPTAAWRSHDTRSAERRYALAERSSRLRGRCHRPLPTNPEHGSPRQVSCLREWTLASQSAISAINSAMTWAAECPRSSGDSLPFASLWA